MNGFNEMSCFGLSPPENFDYDREDEELLASNGVEGALTPSCEGDGSLSPRSSGCIQPTAPPPMSDSPSETKLKTIP